ncbi:MAG: RluA family pseudouridine synthase [Chloroflexota bacterium]|nr:MAG: RluA family pseudouridine synthase [Chloroflexota bacterium]
MEPEVKLLQVTESAIRLDKYLAAEYPELSRSRLQKLIEQGYILVNDCGAKASQKLNFGDKICVVLPPPEQLSLVAEPMPVDVVYEDDDLLVINKPAGLVVHPSPGHTAHTLVNALLARCPGLLNFGDTMRPGIVHRLDRDTSGLMIIAKSTSAQQNLINQFKARSVSKGYLILVKGKLTPNQGIIDAPLGRDPSNRKRMAVVAGGRQARTKYRVNKYLGAYTLLDVTIETGRTHQIRVHLSAIGYPVVGDTVYGVRSGFINRQFVHASRLGFRLPASGEYKEFSCELPPDLKQALRLIAG